MRCKSGRYLKNHKETPEEKQKRIVGMVESWKNRPDYISDIKHPRIYNCWRAMLFTKKGKKAGYSNEWKDYRTFYNDVILTYQDGYTLQRINKNDVFSRDNFIWLSRVMAAQTRDNNILLNAMGERHTISELAKIHDISVSAIRNRYHKHNGLWSDDDIVFGRKKQPRKVITSFSKTPESLVRTKASKMISSYRHKDRVRRFDFNLTIEWMIENIISKPCIYCGTNDFIGCDRIDNNKGHTIDNVVPCCFVCNAARNNNFTHQEMLIIGKTIKQIMDNRKQNIQEV
jgi:hypothetical protein